MPEVEHVNSIARRGKDGAAVMWSFKVSEAIRANDMMRSERSMERSDAIRRERSVLRREGERKKVERMERQKRIDELFSRSQRPDRRPQWRGYFGRATTVERNKKEDHRLRNIHHTKYDDRAQWDLGENESKKPTFELHNHGFNVGPFGTAKDELWKLQKAAAAQKRALWLPPTGTNAILDAEEKALRAFRPDFRPCASLRTVRGRWGPKAIDLTGAPIPERVRKELHANLKPQKALRQAMAAGFQKARPKSAKSISALQMEAAAQRVDLFYTKRNKGDRDSKVQINRQSSSGGDRRFSNRRPGRLRPASAFVGKVDFHQMSKEKKERRGKMFKKKRPKSAFH